MQTQLNGILPLFALWPPGMAKRVVCLLMLFLHFLLSFCFPPGQKHQNKKIYTAFRTYLKTRGGHHLSFVYVWFACPIYTCETKQSKDIIQWRTAEAELEPHSNLYDFVLFASFWGIEWFDPLSSRACIPMLCCLEHASKLWFPMRAAWLNLPSQTPLGMDPYALSEASVFKMWHLRCAPLSTRYRTSAKDCHPLSYFSYSLTLPHQFVSELQCTEITLVGSAQRVWLAQQNHWPCNSECVCKLQFFNQQTNKCRLWLKKSAVEERRDGAHAAWACSGHQPGDGSMASTCIRACPWNCDSGCLIA